MKRMHGLYGLGAVGHCASRIMIYERMDAYVSSPFPAMPTSFSN